MERVIESIRLGCLDIYGFYKPVCYNKNKKLLEEAIMDRKQMAIDYHIAGYNCSQAVLGAFCEELGVDKDTAMKLATGFGGGMRCGEVCGAVTGALMALGMKYGQVQAEDQETKYAMYALTTEFQRRFKEINDTIICKELLGHDISTEEGREQIHSKNLGRNRCDGLIADAVAIVEEMLQEK